MELNKKKLIYVGFSFKHHKNTQAGYHNIKKYLHYDTVIDCQWEHEFLNYNINSFIKKVARKLYIYILGTGGTIAVLQCILLALFRRNQVFHFVYAENTYKWLHLFKGKTNKIACTFHQPIDYFINSPKWKSNLKHIDKVILMSNKDIKQFNEWSGKANAYFIPHGINTDFYFGDVNLKRENHILMVGNWLRDFDLANGVFTKLLEKNLDLHITVVTDKINFLRFKKHERLHLLSGISDVELRSLYRISKCLFLPLYSFTANNAILEAAATGCPIIVATNSIDTSYLNEDNIDFIALDEEIVYEYLADFIKKEFDFMKVNIISKYINDHFSWEVVVQKTKKILNSP